MSASVAKFTLLTLFFFLCTFPTCFESNSPATTAPPGPSAPSAPSSPSAPSASAVLVMCTNSKYYCTGVLVDVLWVLTAAHCLHDLEGELTETSSSVLVVAGSKGLKYAKEEIKSGHAQIRRSDKFEIHDEYDWNLNFVHDLAVIKVSEAFVPSETVKVTVFNKTELLEERSMVAKEQHNVDEVILPCSVYGYGAEKIKKVDLKVSKHCHCLEWIRSYTSPVDILRRINFFVCDNGENDQTGLCAGDNGAPLLCNGALRAVAATKFYYTSRNPCRFLEETKMECGDHDSLNVFSDMCYSTKWLKNIVPSYSELGEQCKLA